MSDRTARRITARLASQPPRIIVLDGYTERTYLKQVSAIEPLLQTSYRLIQEVSGSRSPVKVFVLRDQSDRIGRVMAVPSQREL